MLQKSEVIGIRKHSSFSRLEFVLTFELLTAMQILMHFQNCIDDKNIELYRLEKIIMTMEGKIACHCLYHQRKSQDRLSFSRPFERPAVYTSISEINNTT